MRSKTPVPRQETSGVVYWIPCSWRQNNYNGETGRHLRTRMAEHVATVKRNKADSQIATYSKGPGHTFKFHKAEILARGDNRVSCWSHSSLARIQLNNAMTFCVAIFPGQNY
uniref:GIY-YIG domain-containing protein n=1 Tax=Schistocephalus solidus TaxID=70667 RepID=A0A0X3Q5K5_SCHSO